MAWLAKVFGGILRPCKPRLKHRKSSWRFDIAGSKARETCLQLIPFLKEKGAQAKLLVAHQDTRVYSCKVVPLEVAQLRWQLYTQCRELKAVKVRPEIHIEPLASNREDDLRYAAGLIDGEGHINVRTYLTSMGVSNTYGPVVYWLRELFGGKVDPYPPHLKRKATYKDSWWWIAGAEVSVATCKELLPFLREKQERAEILIAYQGTKGYKKWNIPIEIRTQRADLLHRYRDIVAGKS